MIKINYDKKQLIIIVLIVMFFFMLFGLNNRLSELFHLTDQQASMQTKVASLKNTEMALSTQIAVATSNIAVEAWARDQGHMAQAGDNVIIPIRPSSSPFMGSFSTTATPNTIENWQIWWDLFFAK
jgi:cell division protein FtsB